jgi:predicted transcriptional regulator
MEVSFSPAIQAKLDEMARESGRSSTELVEDALVGYFDEVSHGRNLLDRRFDELETGAVELIDGEEAYRWLKEKTAAQRNRTK